MPRHARIHFVSNKSSLVNLPISLYGPLLERNIRPQNVAVVLSKVGQSPKNDIYVGWTGMLAASSVARFSGSSATAGDSETVEIDPQFAAGLGLAQGDTVEVGLAHDLPRAKMVTTEPLTADDWEIIELHAEHVESTLLSQVRVATLGQELDVWVHGATRVRLRATALDPPSAKALLLTTDTELSIAPKTHARPAASAKVSNPAVENSLSTPSSTAATSKLQPALTAILRVLPPTLISRLPHAGEEPVACVSSSLLASLPSGSYSALIRVLRAPADPEDSPTSAPAPEAKLLELGRASTSNEGKPDTAKDGQRTMPIVPLSEVPEGQIVIVGGATRAGSDGEPTEWDRVLLSVLPASRNPEPTPELVHRATKSPIHSLAGVDAVLKASGDYCKAAFALSRSGRPSGLPALLITGRSGSGKTEVARAVARGMQYDGVHAYVRYVDLARYKERPARSLRELFVAWRDAVAWRGPGVLILDNLEAILGVEAEHADSFRTRHATEAFLSVFARQPVPNVLIIGTTQSDASLHSALGAAHVFKKTVALRAPDKDARKMILEQSLRQRLASAQSLLLDDAQAPNALALATQTEGYSATDLRDLVGRAVHVAAARSAADSQPSDRATLKMQDFTEAQEGFVPRALRDVLLQTSTVAWTDIGGLNDTRRVLRETLEWPTKYAAIFKQSPLRLRSGLLLYGYPGCGKTMLASAVARECGLNFISVKGPELLNKYIGASEKSVRDVFERASAAKPCVLFFDEFDSIAPKRGHDSTGVTDRVVNQLLTLMDGAEGLDGVYVLAATSRPDLIDSALLRPGRLDKALLCNMPSAAERKEILEAHALKVPVHNIVDFTWVADATEGFSGADLQALIYNAHLALVHADIGAHASLDDKAQDSGEQRVEFVRFGGRQGDSGLKSRAEELELQRRIQRMMSLSGQGEVDTNAKKAPVHEPVKHEITDVHLRSALKDARPSVAKEEVARLSRIYSAFVDGRTGEMPVPPEAGGIGQRATLM
ncbi:AAA-domain-containing protein [Peniophora sp. CONT]|nr:AAA-domain-containing protein [Peniophora sp. CONT]